MQRKKVLQKIKYIIYEMQEEMCKSTVKCIIKVLKTNPSNRLLRYKEK